MVYSSLQAILLLPATLREVTSREEEVQQLRATIEKLQKGTGTQDLVNAVREILKAEGFVKK